MFGGKELEELHVQKQALLLQSNLNRAALQAEMRHLRAATTWMRQAARISRELTPWLALLASVAGFFAARGTRRSPSWFSRIMTAFKWLGPLYGLWKRSAAGRGEADADDPAV